MTETRKEKIARQQGHAADRAFDPIRAAMDRGDLVITPLTDEEREGLRAGVRALTQKSVDLAQQLTECQRTLQQAKATIAELRSVIISVNEEKVSALREIQTLRENLRTYGRHKSECRSHFCGTCGEQWSLTHKLRRQHLQRADCTCGLAAALAGRTGHDA